MRRSDLLPFSLEEPLSFWAVFQIWVFLFAATAAMRGVLLLPELLEGGWREDGMELLGSSAGGPTEILSPVKPHLPAEGDFSHCLPVQPPFSMGKLV